VNKKQKRKYHKIVNRRLSELGFKSRAGYPGEQIFGYPVIKYYWRENMDEHVHEWGRGDDGFYPFICSECDKRMTKAEEYPFFADFLVDKIAELERKMSAIKARLDDLLTGEDEYIDCPKAIGKPRWCDCHGYQYSQEG